MLNGIASALLRAKTQRALGPVVADPNVIESSRGL